MSHCGGGGSGEIHARFVAKGAYQEEGYAQGAWHEHVPDIHDNILTLASGAWRRSGSDAGGRQDAADAIGERAPSR